MAKKKAAKPEDANAAKVAAKPKKAPASKPAPKPKRAASRGEAQSSGDSKAKAASKPRPKAAQPAARSKSKSSSDQYADPALRDRLKDEIMRGDKGGKPGQWSARKAQLLASEYKKAGGEYKNDEGHKSEDQKHLDQWTEEDWRTSDGKPADREGGTTRYLPAEAWDQLTPAQKRATNAKKREGSRAGKQFVANTDQAKGARKAASEGPAGAKKSPARKSSKPAASASAQGGAKPRPKAKPKARPKKAD